MRHWVGHKNLSLCSWFDYIKISTAPDSHGHSYLPSIYNYVKRWCAKQKQKWRRCTHLPWRHRLSSVGQSFARMTPERTMLTQWRRRRCRRGDNQNDLSVHWRLDLRQEQKHVDEKRHSNVSKDPYIATSRVRNIVTHNGCKLSHSISTINCDEHCI